MRVPVPIDAALRLISPGPVVLASALHKDRFTVTPIGWTTPLSLRPPIVGIVVQQTRFLIELIRASGEFGLSIVTPDDAAALFRAGLISGRAQEDKFFATTLKPIAGTKIAAPLVDSAIAHLECAVERIADFHDHSLVAGEILAASAEEGLFDGTWGASEKGPLFYLGQNRFAPLGERFSVG